MRSALHAEWTKIRTVAGPLWLLLGAVAATVGAGATAVVTCTAIGCGGDTTKVSLMGVYVGQALVIILAVLVISGEYSSGMIRTTLTAMPRRAAVFAAKAIVLIGVVAVAGTVAVLGALLAGRLGHGHQTLSPVAGTVLYLILIALLSLGVATAVRDSATSIGVVLGLLYVVPIISQAIGDPHWRHLLQMIAPMGAGLGVTAGWAVVALLAGGFRLQAL